MQIRIFMSSKSQGVCSGQLRSVVRSVSDAILKVASISCWQSENHFLCPLLLLVTIYRVISTTFKSKHPKNTNQAPQNHNHCHLRTSSQLLSGHQEIRTGSSNSTANPFTSSYFLLEYEWTSENQCCLRIHSTTADCDARILNWKIHLHDHRSIFVFSEGKIYGVWCMEA